MARRLVIAAGGTGGHMFPAQALAEEMLARGWEVELASDARGLRYADGFPSAVARIELRSGSPARGGLTARLAAPVSIIRGTISACIRYRAHPPAVVAGFGGYPALPALGAALAMGLPRLIHEQNGVLGRVNRLFARRVQKVVCGTWPLRNAPSGADIIHLGNPVRQAVIEAAATPYSAPDMPPDARPGQRPLRVLVFGGSQGASAFARLVPPGLAALPEDMRRRLSVTQQVRPGEEKAVAAAYIDAGIDATLAPFFADLPARMAEAQLVIARAGASTLAEIAAIGRPAILVPYPAAADDHQTANAEALVQAGGALLAPEAGLTAASLAARVAGILADPEGARRMAEAAKAQGKPRAAADLADLVEALGKPPGR